MKKSPFYLLKDYIENNRIDLALELQKIEASGKKPNPDVFLAQSLLLEKLISVACFIEKYHEAPPW